MQQKESNFRNNLSKCWHNDTGYCKFKEECRKQHSTNIFQNQNCDQKCPERHPKECKFSDRCKFSERGICAFSHSASGQDSQKVESVIKHIENKMKDIEKTFAINKSESDDTIKSLVDEIKTLRKECSDNVCSVKKIEQKNEILETNLKQYKQENKKLLKDIDNAVHSVEDKCNKVVKEANEKHDKTVKLAVENALNQFRAELENKTTPDTRVNDKNLKQKTFDTLKKPKISKAKIKELKEQRVIKGFEKDSETFCELRINCGLDVKSKKCKKCDFESHSEGLLRMHKEEDHKIKQTFVNLVLGFESDIQNHIEVLKAMDDEIDIIKCN